MTVVDRGGAPLGWADAFRKLGIDRVPVTWIDALRDAPDPSEIGALPFLRRDYLGKTATVLGLSRVHQELVQDIARSVERSEELAALSWLWNKLLFGSEPTGSAEGGLCETVAQWPTPRVRGIGDPVVAGMWPALILLSGYPTIIDWYGKRGIPATIARCTLSETELVMNEYRDREGVLGLGTFYLQWMLHHFRGSLYRIGALEFETRILPYDVRVLRRLTDGRTTVLVRRNGAAAWQIVTSSPFGDPQWSVVSFDEHREYFSLTEVNPDGAARVRRLSKQSWTLALSPGSWALDVHIPPKTQLDMSSVAEALHDGEEFFRSYFPERDHRAFICTSWLLNPYLEGVLCATSNILRFQRLFVRFCIDGPTESVYWFVYRSSRRLAVSELPETTSLQRRLKGYLAGGGTIVDVAGVRLLEGTGRDPNVGG